MQTQLFGKLLLFFSRKQGISPLRRRAAHWPEATKRLLAKMMTMEAKYPEECDQARADSWAKLVAFFREW